MLCLLHIIIKLCTISNTQHTAKQLIRAGIALSGDKTGNSYSWIILPSAKQLSPSPHVRSLLPQNTITRQNRSHPIPSASFWPRSNQVGLLRNRYNLQIIPKFNKNVKVTHKIVEIIAHQQVSHATVARTDAGK